MIKWLKAKLGLACLSASIFLVGAKYFAPDFIDPFLDAGNVGLVMAAIKLK